MAKPATLRVDAQKYPHLEANPALERALRIQQALAQGKPRGEAVRLAHEALGKRDPVSMSSAPPPARRPSRDASPRRGRGRPR